MVYFGQFGQDKFLEERVFKSYKKGIFVDVGAHDGLYINNTLFFEKEMEWSGINIEPIPALYEKLEKNRPECKNYNYAVSNEDGDADFILNTGYTEPISGLAKQYDPRHWNRLVNEIQNNGGGTQIVKVKTIRLESLLEKNNIDTIQYLSIDVEGAEFDVIKSINFDKVFIDVIGFENNYNDTTIPIVQYLITKGYKIIPFECLDIFMIHKDSQFLKNIFS